MFAVEKLIEDQKAELRRILQSPKYRSRSLEALAKGINESLTITKGRLSVIGATVDHIGSATGREYYRLNAGMFPVLPDDTDGTDTDRE
jgi:hypothetical protein